MRVPFSWLKEFAPVDVSPNELAFKLRQVGVPVVRVEILGEGISGVYSGKIVSLEAHPNADKLRVAKVELGRDTLQIVTGARNVSQGDIVPVAKIGACLAGGKVIEEAKLRGLPSFGMMCSADELALDLKEALPQEQREGVLILEPETPVGIDLGPVLGLNEAVLVLEPFANRPDFLSVFGVAREAAAAFGVPLKPPELYPSGKVFHADITENGDSPSSRDSLRLGTVPIFTSVKISIEDAAGCTRYMARHISNVKAGPSPLWMAARLSAAGIRPISYVVDITNYVLLELGQPLHAFDLATLAGSAVRIRRAQQGERLVGLDGKPYALSEEMLVIADGKEPVALAGILGGKATEISEKTNEVLLESANFSPGLIRRTSLKLGVRTESSRRFEKGLDVRGADWGSRRACHFFKAAGFTISEGVLDLHDTLPKPFEIGVSLTEVKKILGLEELDRGRVNKVLAGLGCKIQSENPLVIEAPLFRGDIREEIDVVEEIARHYGYDRIPTSLPRGDTTVGVINAEDSFDASLRQIFKTAGMAEMISYSLGDPAYFEKLGTHPGGKLFNEIQGAKVFHRGVSPVLNGLVLIRNPLTEDRRALRPLLFPEMLTCVKRNLHVKNRDLAFFEIGKVFEDRKALGTVQGTGPEGTCPQLFEKRHAACVLTGKLPWGQEVSFFTLKGLLEVLWERLHVVPPLTVRAGSDRNFHPLRFAEFGDSERTLGFLGEMHPKALELLGMEEKVMVMEFDVELLQNLPKKIKIKPPPLYPESRRDVSMIVEERVPAGDVQAAIRKAGEPLIEDVRIFDLYQGPQIPPGKKSIALTLIYRASDRTLTDEEVNRLHSKILVQLETLFTAELRV